MNEKNIAIGVSVLELILKYGLPMTLQLIRDLSNDNPTADDIRALANRVPSPDTYEA